MIERETAMEASGRNVGLYRWKWIYGTRLVVDVGRWKR